MPKAPVKKASPVKKKIGAAADANVHPSRAKNFEPAPSMLSYAPLPAYVEEEYVPQFTALPAHEKGTVAQLSAMTPHEIAAMAGQPCSCADCCIKCISIYAAPRRLSSNAATKQRLHSLLGFTSYYVDVVSGVDSQWTPKECSTWTRWLRETSARIANRSLRMEEALMLFAINPQFEQDITFLAGRAAGPRAMPVPAPVPGSHSLTSPPSSP